jgi:hypothetical protein
VPHQDSLGRWISDDGLQYWDGTAWRPLAAQAGAPPGAPAGRSALPAILIGCGAALIAAIIIGILIVVVLINNPEFKRSFCASYTNSNPNLVCPFASPSS